MLTYTPLVIGVHPYVWNQQPESLWSVWLSIHPIYTVYPIIARSRLSPIGSGIFQPTHLIWGVAKVLQATHHLACGSMAWNRAVGPNHSLDIETSTTFNVQLIVGLHSIFRIRYLGWSFPFRGRYYYIYYWDDSRIQKNMGLYAGNQTDWLILQSSSNRNGWSMLKFNCVI